jgi:hypothetical protein
MYREEMRLYPRILHIFFAGIGALAIANVIQLRRLDSAALLLVLLSIIVLIDRMRVTVDATTVRVQLGCTRLFDYRIARAEITAVESVTFQPLKDFKGWGVRCGNFRGRATGCLSLRGDQGVLLTLAQPRTICRCSVHGIIIASQTPDQLLKALTPS